MRLGSILACSRASRSAGTAARAAATAVRATRQPPATSVASASPPRHGEHPLDRGRVGRVAVARSRAATPRTARAGERAAAPTRSAAASVGSSAAASSSSRSASSAQQLGLAGEQGGHVALGDVVEQRQQLVADAVAAERGVVVRGSSTGVEAERRAQSARCRAGAGEQRAAARRARMPRQAVEPGAAQQVEQHGLGLVVGGVAR